MTIRHLPWWWRARMIFGPAERWALATWGAALVFMVGLWVMDAVMSRERQGAGLLGVITITGLWSWLWSGNWKTRP